jgi:hypothetical protein
MPRRQKTMKGGFWDSLSSAWAQTKKASTDAYGSATGSSSPALEPVPVPPPITPTTPPVSTPPPASTPPVGGRRRRTSKRGGYSANTPTNGLASTASPFSGKTAQPHVWVGGKTRRRNKQTKSRKYKKSRKH